MDGDRIRIETTRGPFFADVAICGLGTRQNVHARPELSSIADSIALWRDRFTPPAGKEDPLLDAFPYLGADHAFQEKVPGSAPWLVDIHLFGIGSTLSFGPSGSSSIDAMTIHIPKLASGITRGPFEGDLRKHRESLQACDVKQVEFDWSRLITE